MHPHLLTINEVAAILRVTPLTVRRLVARRLLPRVTTIRHIRIPANAVEDLIANRSSGPRKGTGF